MEAAAAAAQQELQRDASAQRQRRHPHICRPHLVPSVETKTSPTATIKSEWALSRPPLPSGSAGFVSKRRGAAAGLKGKLLPPGWHRW